MYVVSKDYLPINTSRRSGKLIDRVAFIVAHDTGNKDSSAQGNVSYYKSSANVITASAHVFIDDKAIIECIPLTEKAWHVLYSKPTDNILFGDDANDVAIGVELCYFSDSARTREAYKRYVWYLAHLCRLYKFDAQHITGHHILDPERKTDPVNALKTIGKTFKDLQDDVAQLITPIKEDKPVTIPKVTDEKNASADKSFVEAQKWVKANGISDGTYPHRAVTRQELWSMLLRADKAGK
ncbi:MAG TPA: peptidoglycan recognition family protein [Paenisporosarcina sp.]|nr:peptidoglycan recognition family protein [Paenisporosarcina sp.]